MLRLEYSPTGRFEDRATQMVVNRDLGPVDFQVVRDAAGLHLFTEALILDYDEQAFSASGLTVRLAGPYGYHSQWRYGVAERAEHLPSRQPRRHRPHPRHDRRRLRAGGRPGRHQRLRGAGRRHHRARPTTGWRRGSRATSTPTTSATATTRRRRPRLLPAHRAAAAAARGGRWATGGAATTPTPRDEYQALIERFEAEDLPFSVAVVDIDWHWIDVDPKYGTGWTGYSWNTDLFPDPPAFLAWLHEHGLKVSLNVHPADGVRAYEDRYAEMATRMGIDPASGQPVNFDIADRDFLTAYFEELHHPLEAQGVDFWWLDWQQGSYTSMPGLDPLWMLNHFHFLDSARDGKRPITFSRYAGPGSHRYPVGLLRRHRHLLGEPGLPAVLHRHRRQHRLRLVEPRHRRPHVRHPRRRAGHPLVPARHLLPDQPAALHQGPVRGQGAVEVLRAGPGGDGREPAAAAPADPLPVHDGRARAPAGRAAGASAVPPRPAAGGDSTSTNTFAFGSELLVAPITTPADRRTDARPGHHLAAGRGVDRLLHRRPLLRRTHRPAAPAAATATRCWRGPARSCRWPTELGVGNPDALRAARVRRRRRRLHPVRGRRPGRAALGHHPATATTRPPASCAIEPAPGALDLVPEVRGYRVVLHGLDGVGAADPDGHVLAAETATGPLVVELSVPTAVGAVIRLTGERRASDNRGGGADLRPARRGPDRVPAEGPHLARCSRRRPTRPAPGVAPCR